MLRTLILGLAALAVAEDMSAAEHAAMAHTTGLAEHKVGLHEDHPLVRDPTKLIGLDDEQNAEYQAAKAAPGDGKKLDDLIPEDHPWRNGALPHGDGKFMGDAAATAEFNEGHPMVGGDEQGDETEHGNDFLSSYKHMYDDDVPYYDSFKPKWYELTYERKHFILNVITAALLLFLAVSCFRFHLDGIKNWWRRRVAAAQYKKMKKDDNDKERGDPEDAPAPTFLETLRATFTRDATRPCVVDIGYTTHTIDVSCSALQKVSELPFILQEACRYSGVGEVAALSLVDLWLKERAIVQYVPLNGNGPVEVGKGAVAQGITPAEVRKAKSYKVTILPQTTR